MSIDNAQFHRKGALREISSPYRVPILFLPSYSPDYNPIENWFAALDEQTKIRLWRNPESSLV